MGRTPASTAPAAPPAGPLPGPPGAPGRRPLHAWWSADRITLAFGLLLALGVLVAAALYAVRERQSAVEEDLRHAELLARVLEEHATRSVETVGLALVSLGEVLAGSSAGGGASDPGIGAALGQTLAGLPLLREVALVDENGAVVASTAGAAAPPFVELARLGPLPDHGRGRAERIGAFVPGRGLDALARDPARRRPAPPGVGFVPLVRAVPGPAPRRWLVGLINPDVIANHQTQTLADDTRAAALAGYGGDVLAATRSAGVAPGARIATLPPFAQFLPGREHATWIGPGLRPETQTAAFRASRTLPLVVLVEKPEALALATWRRDTRLVLVLAALAAAALALLSWVTARSLVARARVQARIEARERELSVIVRSVQELLLRTDAKGRLVFANERWSAASPVPLAEATGQPLAALVRPQSAAAVAALFGGDAALAGGLRTAQVLIGPAEAPRRFDLALAPLVEGGRVTGFAGSAVDVTERDTAQERLAEQLAFNRLLLEVMPLPVSVLDLDGRYVTVNPAWEAFTGRRRATVLGHRARDYLPADEAELHDARDRELLAGASPMRYEAAMHHPDGTRRDLALTKAVIPGPDGRPTGSLVTVMDVSEFREAERAIREARDIAEEASRAKSEFIANISHELRTPLQSIIGFSELGGARAGATPRLQGMFQDIHAAGNRMLALVNDLLDVARIESTVGVFHAERTDVRVLVREVARELAPLLAARRLELVLDLSDAPLVAKVDPMRFQQVVRNVLANAVRFSPPGRPIEVTADIEGQEVEIAVRDHGPGIPPGELEAIFEAFVQSSRTKDGSGGTGLGLAICRKIVEAHGGRIRAENAEGGGSVFRIALPARGGVDTQPAPI